MKKQLKIKSSFFKIWGLNAPVGAYEYAQIEYKNNLQSIRRETRTKRLKELGLLKEEAVRFIQLEDEGCFSSHQKDLLIQNSSRLRRTEAGWVNALRKASGLKEQIACAQQVQWSCSPPLKKGGLLSVLVQEEDCQSNQRFASNILYLFHGKKGNHLISKPDSVFGLNGQNFLQKIEEISEKIILEKIYHDSESFFELRWEQRGAA